MSDINIIRNYIIIFAIILAPIVLIVTSAILSKSKNKMSKWLLAAGGLYLGLLILAAIVFTMLNFVTI